MSSIFGFLKRNICSSGLFLSSQKRKDILFQIKRKPKKNVSNHLMYVFLLSDVSSIGLKNMSALVPRGFARHFLFPKRLALPLNPRTLRQYPDILKRPISYCRTSLVRARNAYNCAIKELSAPYVCQVGNPKSMLITPWHLAPILTKERKIDIQPENLIFSDGFIIKPGNYKIKVKLNNGLSTILPVIVRGYEKGIPRKIDTPSEK